MKRILIILLLMILFLSCNNKKLESNFYKNLYTGEIISKKEFKNFRKNIFLRYNDTLEDFSLNFIFKKQEKFSDSIIQNFKYNLRVNGEYIIRENLYKKIGMKINLQTFKSLEGKKIKIGGKQEKPTLINLWFVNCPGCVAEIPSLNRLKEKYKDKVNFIAMTFEKESKVSNFLKKKKFNYHHIVNVEKYIKNIASYPYPETIFIDKNGYITNIEGPILYYEGMDIDLSIKYFESIIKRIL